MRRGKGRERGREGWAGGGLEEGSGGFFNGLVALPVSPKAAFFFIIYR